MFWFSGLLNVFRMKMCGHTFESGSGFTTCCPLIELQHGFPEREQHEKTENNTRVKSPLGITNYNIAITIKILAFFFFFVFKSTIAF